MKKITNKIEKCSKSKETQEVFNKSETIYDAFEKINCDDEIHTNIEEFQNDFKSFTIEDFTRIVETEVLVDGRHQYYDSKTNIYYKSNQDLVDRLLLPLMHNSKKVKKTELMLF